MDKDRGTPQFNMMHAVHKWLPACVTMNSAQINLSHSLSRVEMCIHIIILFLLLLTAEAQGIKQRSV